MQSQVKNANKKIKKKHKAWLMYKTKDIKRNLFTSFDTESKDNQ